MDYSFSTVYMTVIVCNILLALITICFQNTKILINMGYKLLALFVSFCFLRLLLPFEFPFANRVILPEWISFVIYRIRHSFASIAGYDVSIWTILQAVWLIGILVRLIYYLYKYQKSRYKIMTNSLDITESARYQTILDQICRERGKKNNFRILETTGIISPMITGVFNPWIMLPDHIQYTDKDLYYVFLHETAHHFHHDLFIKHCVSLITIVYWWNPLCYILVKKTNNILEMRVDDKVTSSDPETICAYLNCLYNLMDQALSVPMPTPLFSGAIGIDMVLMKKRFAMLTQTKQKRNIFLNVAISVLVFGLFAWSYLYIYEGSYIPPEIAETTHSITESNGCAVLKQDGTYDIYYDGTIFLENVDSLECYSSDIPIYIEKEFVNEKQ